jgi:hypothetical protein
MKYQIIDDFLPHKEFLTLKNFIISDNFSWSFSNFVSNENEKLKLTSSYYFQKLFYLNLFKDPNCEIFSNILNKLKCKSVIRIKSNLYPSTNIIEHHEDHVDLEFSHKAAVFYLNNNNGFTVLENNVCIESIENRVLLFDGSTPHHSTTCTNSKYRITLNLNYF